MKGLSKKQRRLKQGRRRKGKRKNGRKEEGNNNAKWRQRKTQNKMYIDE